MLTSLVPPGPKEGRHLLCPEKKQSLTQPLGHPGFFRILPLKVLPFFFLSEQSINQWIHFSGRWEDVEIELHLTASFTSPSQDDNVSILKSRLTESRRGIEGRHAWQREATSSSQGDHKDITKESLPILQSPQHQRHKNSSPGSCLFTLFYHTPQVE